MVISPFYPYYTDFGGIVSSYFLFLTVLKNTIKMKQPRRFRYSMDRKGKNMQAVLCPVCKNLVGPGDYGSLKVASTGLHFPNWTDGRFADVAESLAPDICAGSQQLGQVMEVKE
jgi:hypothetical protein